MYISAKYNVTFAAKGVLTPHTPWLRQCIHTYSFQSRCFASLLSYWKAKDNTAPLGKRAGRSFPLAPVPLAVFEKIHITDTVV